MNPKLKELAEKSKGQALTMDMLAEFFNEYDASVKSYYDEKIKEAQKQFNLTGNTQYDEKAKELEGKKEAVEFFRALARGEMKTVKRLHESRAKAMNEGTGSAGGYLVPVEFDRMVRMYLDDYSQLRSRATVLQMNSKTLNLNALTAGVTISKPGEATAGSASTPTFAEPILTARKRIGYTIWSNEVYEDAEVDILNILAQKFAEAIAKDEQQDCINSAVSGSEGLLTVSGVTNLYLGGGSTSGKTAFSNIDWDVISLAVATAQGISMADAQNLSILMHPTIYHTLRILKTSGSGEFYLPMAPSDQNKPTAWGFEIVLVNEMPALSATAVSTKFVVVTNLKTHLFIGDRSGLKVKIMTEGTIGAVNLGETDQEAIRVTKRSANTTALQNGIITISTSAS